MLYYGRGANESKLWCDRCPLNARDTNQKFADKTPFSHQVHTVDQALASHYNIYCLIDLNSL